MFDDKFFEQWLDSQAQRVMNLIAEGKAIAPEDMIILTLKLKAQTNHFAHLDQGLRTDMQGMDKRLMEELIELRKDMDKRFEQVNKRLSEESIALRQDMDKRFEQVDKRFEQVDKRFEQVDKRFEALTVRIDRFMIWSFSITVTVGGLVVAAIKFLPS